MMSLDPSPESLRVRGGDLRLWRHAPRKTEGKPEALDLPRVHFAHATGFHGRTYAPLYELLTSRFDVLAWDMRGHGESGSSALRAAFRDWSTYYDDLVALIDREGPLFLAGHSVGAVISLLAAAQRPDKVLGLLLIDPVLLAPRYRWFLLMARLVGAGARFSLARNAARRRRFFESPEATFEAYRGRGAFRTWPDEWLWAYVRHGVVPEGDGVRLACEPAFESTSFAAVECRPWARARTLTCPITLLVGETGSTCHPHSRRTLQRRYRQTRITTVPGTSHFLPMERPDRMAGALDQLAGLATP